MRRVLISTLVGGLAATGAFLLPAAHANSNCPVGVNGLDVPPSGSGGLSVGVGIGCITASGDASGPSGYVVADGNADNATPLDGYIGVQGSGGGLQVVGCASGEYDPASPDPAAHNVVFDTNNPPSSPPSTDGPCALP